ncbi:MAG: porin [Rhodobacterales bacterium]|nr:porin [Rhodobacterales bacterium]MDX5412300.1 porin [Rhodobacterales bacterium]
MKRSLAVLLATISAPSLAAAQDLSGGVTLGFGQHDVSEIGQDLSTSSLDGRVDFAFANGMTFGVSAGYLDLGIDGTPMDVNADFIALNVGYKLSNGLSFGAYAERLNGSVTGLPIDLSLKSIGAEMGYATGNLELGMHLGRTSTSPDLPIDIDNVGLTAKYAAMPNLDIAGAFLRANLSMGGMDADIDMIGLAAAYDINDQFSLFGGVSRTSQDDLDLDVTTMGLGVGYDLAQMTGMASVVSLELARTDLSMGPGSTDLDTLRLGLTFPLGGKGTEAPLNSVADSIFNPRHGAVNAALTGAF